MALASGGNKEAASAGPGKQPGKHAATQPGDLARGLLRRAERASLATSLRRDESGDPYASLVIIALDQDASPLLLLSDLADHTANLKVSPRAGLLIDGTAGYDDPLTGPRISLQGSLARTESANALQRFTRRHPGAALYAGFGDFNLYRFEIEKGHLVAGFGDIHWLAADRLLHDCGDAAALAAAEADIVAHMNEDHGDALALMAGHLLHREGAPWIMTGIDPEGLDLRGPGPEGALQRLDFDQPVKDAESARAALVALTRKAREAAASG